MAFRVTFPVRWNTVFRDIFSNLQQAESAFPWEEHELVSGATSTPLSSTHAPLSFTLDTTIYTNHRTEVYDDGKMTATLSDGRVGVSAVESIGNWDQDSFLNRNARFGNLWLLTSHDWCQDLSPQMESSRWRFDRFSEALYELSGAQEDFNGQGPSLSLFGFPESVSEAKETMSVIVTVLPGPAATHVPSEKENDPNAVKQGEWPLAWSAMVYTPAKPVLPLSEEGSYFCSRVVEAHGDSTPIIQFGWSIEELVAHGGAMTFAHDINNFKAVLRGDRGNIISLFSITLVKK